MIRILCPHCGEELIDPRFSTGMRLDEKEWERRVEEAVRVFGITHPDMSEAEVRRSAVVSVSVLMAQEWEDEHMKEATKQHIALHSAEVRERQDAKQVYFMQGVSGGPIKIGFSSNVERRRKAIEQHEEIVVLALLDGDEALEHELHSRFAPYRLAGEWFEPADELLQYIEDVRDRS